RPREALRRFFPRGRGAKAVEAADAFVGDRVDALVLLHRRERPEIVEAPDLERRQRKARERRAPGVEFRQQRLEAGTRGKAERRLQRGVETVTARFAAERERAECGPGAAGRRREVEGKTPGFARAHRGAVMKWSWADPRLARISCKPVGEILQTG